jgi:uncharacterized protein (TIGR03086 family)
MTTTADLGPATSELARLVHGVSDEMLGWPTPCPDYTLGDLLDHVGGLAMAFTAAATKDVGPEAAGAQGPSGDASRLTGDWRGRIAADLDSLAEAWRDPEAYQGMTRAGGVDLPGEVAALVALDEVVVHGWDVARASGQPYRVDHGLLELVRQFVAQFSGPGNEEQRTGLFGPEVAVPADAPALDRVIGMTGRDPQWRSEQAPVAR